MPAPLSVIIPTLNSASTLGPVLGGLRPGLEAGLIRELILSDGGSTDATEQIADEVGAEWISGPRGRGPQLARAGSAARGEWMLFLHSDTVLSDDWASAVCAHLSQTDRAGYFRLRFDCDGFAPRIVAGWANLRSRMFGLPYGDQGLLISRVLYDRIGGYSELALMEDVEIAGRLRGALKQLDATATTGAERYQRAGWLRQGARNIMRFARFKAGVPAERLVRDYAPE